MRMEYLQTRRKNTTLNGKQQKARQNPKQKHTMPMATNNSNNNSRWPLLNPNPRGKRRKSRTHHRPRHHQAAPKVRTRLPILSTKVVPKLLRARLRPLLLPLLRHRHRHRLIILVPLRLSNHCRQAMKMKTMMMTMMVLHN